MFTPNYNSTFEVKDNKIKSLENMEISALLEMKISLFMGLEGQI